MKFFRDLLLTGISILVILVLIEAGLRVGGAKYAASFYTPERERGYALRPLAEGWYTEEGQCYVRISSTGLRDREHSIDPANDHTLRIAIIGSSEVAAMQMPLDKRFTADMEHRLTPVLAAKGWQPEVLDFGGPGYGPAQEYLTLHNHVWEYHPQVVIFMLSTWSILKNTRKLDPGSPGGVPYFVFKDGQLVPDARTAARPKLNAKRVHWKNKLSALVNRSVLLSLIRATGVNLPRRLAAIKASLRHPHGTPRQDYSKTWPYLTDLPQMQDSWAITEGFFDLMKRESDQHNAEFWIVVADMDMQTYVNVSKREEFQKQLGIDSLYKPEARVQKFADAHNIPTIMLAPPLAEYSASHHVPLHGFFNTELDIGHWNELGHQLVGKEISNGLLERSQLIHSLPEKSLK